MSEQSERLTLTVDEAAKLIGVSRYTLYEAVRTGSVPTIRLGRRILIPRHALLGFMGAPSAATPKAVTPQARSYEEGVADERARVTDLLIRLLAEVRSS
jgi:excisionase family DNA binding protein